MKPKNYKSKLKAHRVAKSFEREREQKERITKLIKEEMARQMQQGQMELKNQIAGGIRGKIGPFSETIRGRDSVKDSFGKLTRDGVGSLLNMAHKSIFG